MLFRSQRREGRLRRPRIKGRLRRSALVDAPMADLRSASGTADSHSQTRPAGRGGCAAKGSDSMLAACDADADAALQQFQFQPHLLAQTRQRPGAKRGHGENLGKFWFCSKRSPGWSQRRRCRDFRLLPGPSSAPPKPTRKTRKIHRFYGRAATAGPRPPLYSRA